MPVPFAYLPCAAFSSPRCVSPVSAALIPRASNDSCAVPLLGTARLSGLHDGTFHVWPRARSARDARDAGALIDWPPLHQPDHTAETREADTTAPSRSPASAAVT